jgi:hypothetical protein
MASPDFIRRVRSGEKMDSAGRFVSDVRRSQAQEALDAIDQSSPVAELAPEAPAAEAPAEGGEE